MERNETLCSARYIGSELAVVLQAYLIRFAPSEIAEAFCMTRLGTSLGRVYGDLSRFIY